MRTVESCQCPSHCITAPATTNNIILVRDTLLFPCFRLPCLPNATGHLPLATHAARAILFHGAETSGLVCVAHSSSPLSSSSSSSSFSDSSPAQLLLHSSDILVECSVFMCFTRALILANVKQWFGSLSAKLTLEQKGIYQHLCVWLRICRGIADEPPYEKGGTDHRCKAYQFRECMHTLVSGPSRGPSRQTNPWRVFGRRGV